MALYADLFSEGVYVIFSSGEGLRFHIETTEALLKRYEEEVPENIRSRVEEQQNIKILRSILRDKKGALEALANPF